MSPSTVPGTLEALHKYLLSKQVNDTFYSRNNSAWERGQFILIWTKPFFQNP
jgi:hypothetical protein